MITHPTTGVECSSDGSILHPRDELLHMVNVLSHTVGKHGASSGEDEFLTLLLEPVLIGLHTVDPFIRHIPAIPITNILNSD